MHIASTAHKELFCRSFLESHKVYVPEELPWPELDILSLQRLRALPFWEEALNTEQEAGMMVNAYAATVTDPLVREAIALQGWEETRHAQLLQFVIHHYGITVAERPVAPPPGPDTIERTFIAFGYGECLDSFLAFGLFKRARQSRFFPEPLFTIFDRVMEEEARHIVFFVNWVTYQLTCQGRGAALFRAAHSSWYYGRALRKLWRAIRSPDKRGEGFVATGAGAFIDELTPAQVLSACLEENTRRMRGFDSVLLQPRFMPTVATITLRSLKLLPWRQPSLTTETYRSSSSQPDKSM
jgi:hypothetical protein